MKVRMGTHVRDLTRQWNVWWRTAGWTDRHKVRPWPEALERRALLASITEYPFPSTGATPPANIGDEITVGPDGNVWYTDVLHGSIDQITPDGTITQFPVPQNSYEFGIALDFGTERSRSMR